MAQQQQQQFADCGLPGLQVRIGQLLEFSKWIDRQLDELEQRYAYNVTVASLKRVR